MHQRIVQYHVATREPSTNVLAVIPVFLIYSLGLLVASPSTRNGADLTGPALMTSLGTDGYVIAMLTLAAVGLAFALHRLRSRTFRRALLTLPVVLEATIYALCLSGLVGFVLDEWILLGPPSTTDALVDRTVMAAGAGFHEELVFRLALIPLVMIVAIRALAMPRVMAIVVAVTASGLLFAAAHHLGGESFTTTAFAYRSVAGIVLGLLMVTRGFAVAVWTHANYDFYVAGLA